MTALNESVSRVVMQFRVSFSHTPQFLRYDERAPAARSEQKSGTRIIEPTDKCSLESFIDDLEFEGYMLVDAIHTGRFEPSVIQYLFVRTEKAFVHPGLKRIHAKARSELREMCRTNMWQVCVYKNPFFRDEEAAMSEQYMLSVNAHARKPLYNPDGEPVMIWREKDEWGNPIRESGKIPLLPDHQLIVGENNALCLIEV